MIQKRHAYFQPMGHAHTIDFREDVVGQIHAQVLVEHPIVVGPIRSGVFFETIDVGHPVNAFYVARP